MGLGGREKEGGRERERDGILSPFEASLSILKTGCDIPLCDDSPLFVPNSTFQGWLAFELTTTEG